MRPKAVVIAILTALLLAGAVAMTVNVPAARPASSDPAQKYGVINITVAAATDHEIGGSSAFPNYNTGAIDNYYTLAHSTLDNSPSAEGTSSPADTGPIGQTAAAGNFAQPQYADARWPGNAGKATFGNQGGPYATADAGPWMATATCSEASGGSTGSGGSSKTGKLGKMGKAPKIATPKGFSKRLRHSLRLWKAEWLPRLHLKVPGLKIPTLKIRVLQSAGGTSLPGVSVPSVTAPSVTAPTVTAPSVPTPKIPNASTTTTGTTTTSSTTTSTNPSPAPSSPGNGAFESTTMAGVDPSSGALVSNGESSLGTVNLGSGQILLQGIDASVQVTNDGTPTDKVAVNIANATIGGVPVTIDQDGVHVAGQGGPLPYQQADDALNGALKQAGIQIFTVQPEIKKSTNEVAITASGVHLLVAQQVSPPGVPSQYVEHIVGEVFVDSLAVPGGPIPGLGNLGLAGSGGGGSGGGTAGGGSTGFGSSGSGSTGYSSQPASSATGASQAGSSFLTALTSKPLWLLLTYFLWQSVVLGTGASLWYWRMGGWAAR